MTRHQPADPASTTSTTLVMAGKPVIFQPKGSGEILVVIDGVGSTATAAVNMTVGARFGTGTAPANGDAVTGKQIGVDKTFRGAAATAAVPFSIHDLLSLVPGLSYWIDVAFDTSNGSDAASVGSISILVREL